MDEEIKDLSGKPEEEENPSGSVPETSPGSGKAEEASPALISGVPEHFRAGYVAVVGLPNVGKSTLLNQLLHFKLSIVSPKPQTTRKNVLGILTEKEYQIVFIDTPGILTPRYSLQQYMLRNVKSAMKDADVLVYVVDVTDKRTTVEDVLAQLEGVEKPVILALNKVDLVRKDTLLPLIDQFARGFPFKAIVPISALKNDGLDRLLKEIVACLPQNPPYYPEDYISDQQERFFVAEIIREKVFLLYGEEIPYSTHVEIEEFKEREEGKDYIRAVIYVERPTQKRILIGKEGRALKRVGQLAREEIEMFLGRPVFLELFVKVMEGWRKKEARLRRLGYR
ncbi:MAG: GTPase Era [Calditrichaeota bacterium]|nr:MAG: GTPase Era [Calditrichota bacterium]